MDTYDNISQLIEDNLTPGANTITADLHRAVEQAILAFARDQWLPGDIKEIDCTQDYIDDNFDVHGIGINERLGWAICNGYQGLTKNRAGRVSVGYGAQTGVTSSRLTPGAIGGAETHQLSVNEIPSHGHYIPTHGNDGGGFVGANYSNYTQAFTGAIPDGLRVQLTDRPGSTGKPNTSHSTQQIGGNVAHNNMQPYIVTLFIQKL